MKEAVEMRRFDDMAKILNLILLQDLNYFKYVENGKIKLMKIGNLEKLRLKITHNIIQQHLDLNGIIQSWQCNYMIMFNQKM